MQVRKITDNECTYIKSCVVALYYVAHNM